MIFAKKIYMFLEIQYTNYQKQDATTKICEFPLTKILNSVDIFAGASVNYIWYVSSRILPYSDTLKNNNLCQLILDNSNFLSSRIPIYSCRFFSINVWNRTIDSDSLWTIRLNCWFGPTKLLNYHNNDLTMWKTNGTEVLDWSHN